MVSLIVRRRLNADEESSETQLLFTQPDVLLSGRASGCSFKEALDWLLRAAKAIAFDEEESSEP